MPSSTRLVLVNLFTNMDFCVAGSLAYCFAEVTIALSDRALADPKECHRDE